MNPIAVRLVQNGSRRMRHFYIRAGYLASLIIVLLWVMFFKGCGATLSYRDLAAAGAMTFTVVAYLQVGLLCVIAPVFMAGAISQEANPRTWEVLLTTPMSRAEIVLGNLLGRLFFILALLVASMPLFALTQYFGGVPGRSVMASFLVAGCLALLVGAVAIALSVSRLAGRRAVFTFYVAVVMYLFITIALDAGIRARGNGALDGTGVTWMTAINPFLALQALLSPATYPRAPVNSHTGLAAWFLETPVTAWCVGSALLSASLMLFSTMTVRAGGLLSIVESRGGGGVPWYRKMFGLGAKGAEHRPPRSVWHNPIAWREAAARNSTLGKIVARWAFIGFGVLLGVGLVLYFHFGNALTPDDFRLAIMAIVGAEIGVTTLVAINMAATAISREREDGTLDLLLTTPITPGQYLTGKLRGLVAYLIPMLAVPIVTLLISGIYSMMSLMGGGKAVVTVTGEDFPAVLPEAAIAAAVLLVPFAAFAAMVGLSWSLKSKGTIGSVIATVGIVGAATAFIGGCGLKVTSEISVLGPLLGSLSPVSLVWGLVYPEEAWEATVGSTGLVNARVSMLIGCLIAAGIHVAIVYGLHAQMVRTFDFTVRKLAGTK